MIPSKIHQKFSYYLEQPDALTNPEKYLGPNWQDVLNFWIYIDTLSDLEMKEMNALYLALDCDVLDSADDAACDAAEEVACDAAEEVACDAADDVVGRKFSSAAWCAAWEVTGLRVFALATLELIAHHKLLEQDKTPLALQYCTK